MEKHPVPNRPPDARWGAIDRFFDYTWDRFYRPLLSLGVNEGREYGVIEPAVDLFETDEHMVVKAELPGTDPRNIQVKVTEDSISFRSDTTSERDEQQEGYHYRERRHGLIQRLIPLPRHIDPQSARASFRHGILTIRAKKVGREQGRILNVEVESEETGFGRTQ